MPTANGRLIYYRCTEPQTHREFQSLRSLSNFAPHSATTSAFQRASEHPHSDNTGAVVPAHQAPLMQTGTAGNNSHTGSEAVDGTRSASPHTAGECVRVRAVSATHDHSCISPVHCRCYAWLGIW